VRARDAALRSPRCTAGPRPISDLQTQLDRFVSYYNNQRPHRALGRKTPHEIYDTKLKAHPPSTSPATHFRVRHDIIDKTVCVTLRYNSRLHHIGLGRAHTGTHVAVLVADLDIRVIHADTGELIRQLTLDPTRDYQRRN
jgi:Integrase core domain